MKKYLKIIAGFMERLSKDHVAAFAAQAAYFILLSFIPFLMLLLTLVQYIPPIRDQKIVTDMLIQIMPDTGDFRDFLLNIISEVYAKGTAVVPFTAIFTLWSAGKGVQALTNGVNAIYHVKETRNYVVTRIRSAIYTLFFIIAIIGSLILLVFGNSIQKLLARYIPVLGRVTAYIIGMRTVISLCILVCIFLLIYKFLPNRKSGWKNQIPGAVISAVAWSLFSLGFSIYIDVYDGLSNMYGSLTTIMLILLWMYFCMYIVLIGAEINAYFEDRFRKLHQMASEKIRMEYLELLEGFRGGDDKEDEEGEEKKT
ncbi:MAG: YihY/virulence factor BrkB family protein [Clostridiales bacterium]|nr:YihY/virulence factor BrkB family protein [Clostridiales bacterium]